MAEQRADRPGEQAWAGVGWVQEEATGRGLFVEHEGDDEAQVRADLAASMAALVAGRPEQRFGALQTAVRGGVCHDQPICSLVVAVYEAEGWRRRDVTIDLTRVG
jgi:arginine decarboxylase